LKVQSAIIWQFLNIIIQGVLQLFFIAITARLLPKEVHGAFAIINAIVFLVTLFSEGGVGSALIQQKESNEKDISIAFYTTVLISFSLFLLIFFLSDFISNFYEFKIKASHIKVASLSFVSMTLGKVSRALLIKEFEFKKIFISNITSFIIGYMLCGILLAYNGFGIWSLIFAILIYQSIMSLLFYFFARHSLKFRYGKKEFDRIFYFGSSFTLVRISNYLSSQIDKILLGRLIDTGILGVFEKSQFIAKMPSKYVGNTIDSVLFSYISKVGNKSEKEEYFGLILGLLFLIGTYFGIVLFIYSKIFVFTLLGENWLEVIPLLQIFSLSIPFVLVARLGDIMIRAENKIFYSLPIKIFYISMIVCSIFLQYQNGINTVSGYIVASIIIHSILIISVIIGTLHFNLINLFKKNLYCAFFFLLLISKYYFIHSLLGMFNLSLLAMLLVQLPLDLPFVLLINKYVLPQNVQKFTTKLINPFLIKLKLK